MLRGFNVADDELCEELVISDDRASDLAELFGNPPNFMADSFPVAANRRKPIEVLTGHKLERGVLYFVEFDAG